MTTTNSIMPLLAILVSFFGTLLIMGFHNRPNLRELCTIGIALSKFFMIFSMLPMVLEGGVIICHLVDVLPGVGLAFRVDSLGMIFALVASSLWIVTSIYSMGYMRSLKEHAQTRYFSYFALALSSAVGVAFAANLMTLYLFYEMLSLSTYSLVTHHQDPAARIGGRKYLAYLLGTSIGFLLPAIILTYTFAGTTDFSNNGILSGAASDLTLTIMFFLFLFGIGKAAIMPVHAWLPSAMVAPTPVSALLHAVAVVKAGVFCILRVIFHVYGVDLMDVLNLGVMTACFASFTILVGSLFALSQDNLKARLAYSTVAQLSYVVLGAALLSPEGMFGGTIHVVMHAFGKITLFFCAGAILVATGKKNISEMKGLGKRMPVTMSAFFIGSLSIIGLPPLGGFISKWNLVLGSLESGQVFILVVLLTSSLLNAAYFFPIVYDGFFGKADDILTDTGGGGKIAEAPVLALAPPVLTAAGSIVLFFYAQPFMRLAHMTIASITGD